MDIELGGIVLNQKILFKQFRNDLRDDWFPDPLLFNDVLDKGVVTERLKDNFEKNDGKYLPVERTLFNIPKSNFTLRYALEIGIADRLLYHGLVSFLVPYYDPLIPWFVYSHRRDAHRSSDRYLFRMGIPAWKDFVGSVKSAITEENYFLSTDLANYFEHIDLKKLKKVFVERIPTVDATASKKSTIRSYLGVLFECLEKWAYRPARGLPQNRDASSFLANMYMLPIDLKMQEKGYSYFRYMDDIKVVCRDVHQARKALKELSVLLRDLDLAVNPKKTAICAGSETDQVNEYLDTGHREVERLDAIWSSRSAELIRHSFPDIRSFTESLLKEENVDSREFRYCINRFVLLALCEEFAVPDEYFEATTDRIIDLLPEHPAATDQFCRYLAAVPLEEAKLTRIAEQILDSEKRIYGWQNYRLWLLMAQREYFHPRLMEHALEIIQNRPDGVTRAGATVYAGALGGKPERVVIAENFHNLHSFIGQRCALIASHELKYRPHIEDYVRPHLRDDLINVYRTLRTQRGRYVAPLDRVSITTIVDQERDYD